MFQHKSMLQYCTGGGGSLVVQRRQDGNVKLTLTEGGRTIKKDLAAPLGSFGMGCNHCIA